MSRFVRDVLVSGSAAGVLSLASLILRSRAEHGPRHVTKPVHAVSHIAWDDRPESHSGHYIHNGFIGAALHHGACVFWATFFEAIFGRDAERSTSSALIGGATIASAAYVIDYHFVSARFKPGFEVHLSPRSLLAVYTTLALGFAGAARLRGLYNHQKENRNKRDERRHAERSPDRVIAPE